MTGLEAVTPLKLGGVTPGPVGREPQVVWLSLRDLRIDRRYQRDLAQRSRALIRRMVEGWDWNLCGPITVAELPGGYYELIDGQHRATAAATHGGIHRLPAVIVQAAELADRAQIFSALNSARVAVSALQIFRADLASGETEATRIAAIAAEAGATLVLTNREAARCEPGDTLAVHTLRRLLRAHGDETLHTVLSLCAEAGLAPIRSAHLLAVADLVTAPEFGLDACDHAKLVDGLTRSDELFAMAARVAAKAGLSPARARTMALWQRAARQVAA